MVAVLLLWVLVLMALLPVQAEAVHEGTALGQKALPLAGNDINGKQISLTSLRGHFVMLTFWTRDCPLCIEQLPVYDTYYRKIGAQQLNLVSILLADNLSEDEVYALVRERGYSFPVVVFSGRDRLRLMKDWKVTATPANYLINPEGIIVLKGFLGNEGMALMRKIVEKQRDFLPPEMLLETTLTAGGQLMSYHLTVPEASGRYSFRFRAAAQYVDENGQRGEFEQITPVTLKLAKDTRGVLRAESILETTDRSGKPAKLTDSSRVRVAAKRIGRVVYLEVDLPLPTRVPLAFSEVEYYSSALRAYVMLDSGYPT